MRGSKAEKRVYRRLTSDQGFTPSRHAWPPRAKAAPTCGRRLFFLVPAAPTGVSGTGVPETDRLPCAAGAVPLVIRPSCGLPAYSERCRSPFRDDGDRDSELMPIRSEERRVGKEGRSRWSPYH